MPSECDSLRFKRRSRKIVPIRKSQTLRKYVESCEAEYSPRGGVMPLIYPEIHHGTREW